MISVRVSSMAALACGLLFLAGCLGGQSPPSRFYTLIQSEPGSGSAAPAAEMLLMVGPVTLPDYLNRQQIVTRSGTNELVIDEFNRWGGSLGNDISVTLVTDLATRLGPGGFAVLPWQAIPLTSHKSSYRVSVDITRFEGVLGKEVVLHAGWRLSLKQGTHEQPLFSKEITITEAATSGSYEDLVAAMGRALQKFTALLSDSIVTQSTVKQL